MVGGGGDGAILSQTGADETSFFEIGQAIKFTTSTAITLKEIRLIIGSNTTGGASRSIRIGSTCDLRTEYLEEITKTIPEEYSEQTFTSATNPSMPAGTYCVGIAATPSTFQYTSGTPTVSGMSTLSGWQQTTGDGTWNFPEGRTRYLYIKVVGL